MRKYLTGAVLAGITLAAISAVAFEVRFPKRVARVKAVTVVDETGSLLFGQSPGQVEVTNFPGPPPQATPPASVITVLGTDQCPGGTSLLYAGSVVLQVVDSTTSSLERFMTTACWDEVPERINGIFDGRNTEIGFIPIADCVCCTVDALGS